MVGHDVIQAKEVFFNKIHVSGGNLNLDNTNSRVGVGTSAPKTTFHIFSGAGSSNPVASAETTAIESSAGTNYLNFIGGTSQVQGMLFSDDTRAIGQLYYRHSNNSLNFTTNNADRMILNNAGTLRLFGGGVDWTTAHLLNLSGGAIQMANSNTATAPTAVANSGIMYVSGGALYFVGGGGTLTKVANE